MQNKFALTIVLALLTMVGPLGIDGYLPSFPAITAEFGASPLLVQQTLSLYVGALSIMMLFYGTLSDSFGRRPVMLISLVCFVVTSIAAALSQNIGQLLLFRTIQGLCAGAGMVLSRAMVQDRFRGNEAQRMMAMITMVFGIAPAVAPVIGGWLQATLGWRWVFVFLALFGTAMWFTSRQMLQETLPAEQRAAFNLRSIVSSYRQLLTHPQFLLMAAGTGMVFSGISLYVGSASAFVMGILHLTETEFAWLFIPLVSGLMAGSAVAGQLSHRFAPPRLIRVGFVIMVVSVVVSVVYAAFFTVAVPYAVLPFMVYTFGLSLASPGMTIMTMSVFTSMRGLASAMQGFIQMMLFALISGLLAPLLFGSALELALGHAVSMAIGIALWVMGVRWPARGGRSPVEA